MLILMILNQNHLYQATKLIFGVVGKSKGFERKLTKGTTIIYTFRNIKYYTSLSMFSSSGLTLTSLMELL